MALAALSKLALHGPFIIFSRTQFKLSTLTVTVETKLEPLPQTLGPQSSPTPSPARVRAPNSMRVCTHHFMAIMRQAPDLIVRIDVR